MQNATIARLFEQLADLLELDGANPFRVRAYRNAARKIESLADEVGGLIESGVKLTKLEGIGKDLAAKIETIVETGVLPQLEEMREKFPPDVMKMLQLPGIGPKKVAVLVGELGVETLSDLKEAAQNGQVAALSGFGKKTEQTILENVDEVKDAEQRYYLADAKAEADAVVADLLELDSVEKATVAGSCRRLKETVGDLDVLAVAADSAVVMDRLAENPVVVKVLARGDTKQRVRLASGIELDLRVVPRESYGAAMQYFTGSKEHNIVTRRMAQERGLKLNEYGLFRDDEYVAGETEEDVYAELGLPWVPPELRENRREFEWAAENAFPQLIERDDLLGDLHMHTTATDGTASIAEMAEAAKTRGLEYVAITDHSKRVAMANGLDADRLREHWENVRKANDEVDGIEILCGIECDILEDATLDLPDDVLAEADWVVAVLHYGLKQPREKITERLLNAIRNPHVHAIGHPTGRLLLKRPGASVGFDDVYKACADEGVFLEINAHPSRLDLDDVHAAAAKEHGIPIVIDSDAHSVDGFDVLTYGVYQARRAGLSREDVANTRPLGEFRAMLKTS